MTVRRIAPGRLVGRVEAPRSKSYTHRALVAAFLARRRCRIDGPLDSDDTRRTALGLRALGAAVRLDRSAWTVDASGPPRAPLRPARVDCGESGTTLRFLAALAAAQARRVTFVGAPSLARRPILPLLTVLESGGVRVRRPAGRRSLPFSVEGPLRPGRFRLDPSSSSQFLSALLLVLPSLASPSEVHLTAAAVSQPYVEATVATLAAGGVRVTRRGGTYRVPAPQPYRLRRFAVPGDASSAAYLWAGAAVTGGNVRVDGVSRAWPQADRAILPVLAGAGAKVTVGPRGVRVRGRGLRPFDIDLTDAPDLFPLLGAVASVVPGTSRLRGAPHIALKESDRGAETARLARALGATVRRSRRVLAIRGRRPARAVRLARLADHRLVMSAAVAALAADGPSYVGDVRAVAKSYPAFWEAMGALGARTGGER